VADLALEIAVRANWLVAHNTTNPQLAQVFDVADLGLFDCSFVNLR